VVTGFPSPFGRRHSLLGSSCARWDIDHPYGGPTKREIPPGPHRSCHVPHETDTTGLDALWTPGTVVRSRPAKSLRTAPAALQRHGPYLPLVHPIERECS
jgi:hypothetical protein